LGARSATEIPPFLPVPQPSHLLQAANFGLRSACAIRLILLRARGLTQCALQTVHGRLTLLELGFQRLVGLLSGCRLHLRVLSCLLQRLLRALRPRGEQLCARQQSLRVHRAAHGLSEPLLRDAVGGLLVLAALQQLSVLRLCLGCALLMRRHLRLGDVSLCCMRAGHRLQSVGQRTPAASA